MQTLQQLQLKLLTSHDEFLPIVVLLLADFIFKIIHLVDYFIYIVQLRE